ncbi:response regulator receiver domain-containing protein [Desulfobotulus alkaliphilus]|uniref:Response regulator receiver domain-containing protein n=1 Tax=Desulfobotulus alkaliphilus TaxID=622671 RepID=A0A562RJ47_9BACT|nr:response regulator [Desulfobotulus alkaliphilus]TWI68594.1 response regulator receiver domain-containing protein [Desulfobotulus alkaliphilus]
MKIQDHSILVAEDDLTSRTALQLTLKKWGYAPLIAEDGEAAWEILQDETPPRLLILDWMMPRLHGIDLLRRIRSNKLESSFYIIMLTTRDSTEDIIEGLDAGADDYLTKPFNPGELRARVNVGFRVLGLQATLEKRIRELQKAVEHIQTLQGILPICSFCKKIRNDTGYWDQVESYIAKHSGTRFSHGICPDCLERHYPDFADEVRGQ